ncbi:MAG TPA: hypothetical protein VGS08_05835 [Candidatus Saccharimonadales bacterium]|nr:hypothetical protein [Candidatus Saccharimonadales bacterium]
MPDKQHMKKRMQKGGATGAVYGMGFIGALIFYIHVHSGTFWLVILAVLKAIFWPAFLVYHLLAFLHL